MRKLHPTLILIALSVLTSSAATSTLALDCPTPPSTTHFSSPIDQQRLSCVRPFKIAQATIECLKYCEERYGSKTCQARDCKSKFDECVYACG